MRRFAMVLAVALLAGVAACGADDDLTFDGHAIEDPGGFLARAETAWRHHLAGEKVTIHDDARCYFVVTEGERAVKSVLFCGPARRLPASTTEPTSSKITNELQPQGGLWDKLGFGMNRRAGEQRLSEPTIEAIGIAAPRTAKLVRPDGKTPPHDGGRLPYPRAPRGKPGLTVVSDNATVDSTSHTSGRIVTPTVTIHVTGAGIASMVQTRNGPRSAAKGERLVAAQLELTPGPLAAAYRLDSPYDPDQVRDATPSYAVAVGDHRTGIDLGDATGTHTLVVSAPRSVDPQLVVTVDGVAQRLSLTTGKRLSNNAAAFYRRHTHLDVATEYPRRAASRGDFFLRHSIRFTDAELTAFHPVLGWPAPGKSWLVVDTDRRSYAWNDLYSITVDRARTATVTDADGVVSSDDSPSREQSFFLPGQLIQLAFQVDADQHSFRLTYQPTVSFHAQGPGPDPASGSVRLPALTVHLDFPAR